MRACTLLLLLLLLLSLLLPLSLLLLSLLLLLLLLDRSHGTTAAGGKLPRRVCLHKHVHR